MWHLVQFKEDAIWYVCPPARLKDENGETLVKWPQDSKWYKATIHAVGGELSLYVVFILVGL